MRAWVTGYVGHPFCFSKKNLYVLGEEMKKNIYYFIFSYYLYFEKRN